MLAARRVRPGWVLLFPIWSHAVRSVSSQKSRSAAKRSLREIDTRKAELELTAPWSIVHRPVLETLLKSYAHHPTVAQPLLLHGPRGVGKRTIVEGLLEKWKESPHISAYINLCENQEAVQPWTMSVKCRDAVENFGPHLSRVKAEEQGVVSLGAIRTMVEHGLEELLKKGVEMGLVEGENVVDAMLERHTIDGTLRQFLKENFDVVATEDTKELWKRSIQLIRQNRQETVMSYGTHLETFQLSIDSSSAQQSKFRPTNQLFSASSRCKSAEEAYESLALAKKVLKLQEDWRVASGTSSKRHGRITNTVADAATSWAVLLVRLLSFAAQAEHFQPKLVINNLDLMRKAAAESTEESLHGSLYHDSLLMHITRIGVSVGCIPIIFVSSNSYYSCKILADHGDELAFISQEALGWTPKEAAVHLVPAIFEESEWMVITGVLGANARHLAELHSIWHNPSFTEILEDTTESAIGDCIDLYLGYLQVTAVDVAMEQAIKQLEKFATDVTSGKISKKILRHGVAWRYPPARPEEHRQWAKLQLMDYVQSLAATGFALNHRDVKAKELLEDPSTGALLEVGLLYQQKDLPYIRPITRGVARCLVRWHVRERLNWRTREQLAYAWHRIIRGRFYKQLMVM